MALRIQELFGGGYVPDFDFGLRLRGDDSFELSIAMRNPATHELYKGQRADWHGRLVDPEPLFVAFQRSITHWQLANYGQALNVVKAELERGVPNLFT